MVAQINEIGGAGEAGGVDGKDGAARTGWECCFIPIVAGTKSMKEEAWNEAMEKFGVAKMKWSGGRARLMRVLLEEHEKVLGSFWEQVLGGGKE